MNACDSDLQRPLASRPDIDLQSSNILLDMLHLGVYKYKFWQNIVCMYSPGIIPEFLGKVDETQYGVDGRMSQLVLRLRAYPEPKVAWYYHNRKLVITLSFHF